MQPIFSIKTEETTKINLETIRAHILKNFVTIKVILSFKSQNDSSRFVMKKVVGRSALFRNIFKEKLM